MASPKINPNAVDRQRQLQNWRALARESDPAFTVDADDAGDRDLLESGSATLADTHAFLVALVRELADKGVITLEET